MTDVNDKPILICEKNEGTYAECSSATLDSTHAALEKTTSQQEIEQVYMTAGKAANTLKIYEKRWFN